MYTRAAHVNLRRMGAGQSVEGLRDTADAGAAVHVLDTQGEDCHAG